MLGQVSSHYDILFLVSCYYKRLDQFSSGYVRLLKVIQYMTGYHTIGQVMPL
jgi:hypothetical protein